MACCHHRTGRIEMRNGTDREGAHGVARTAQPVLKMQVGDWPASARQACIVPSCDHEEDLMFIAQRIQLLRKVAELMVPNLSTSQGEVPYLHMRRIANRFRKANYQIRRVASSRLQSACVVHLASCGWKPCMVPVEDLGASYQ